MKIVHCWVVGEEVEDEEEEETIVVLAVVAAVVLAEELKMLQGFIKQNYFLQTLKASLGDIVQRTGSVLVTRALYHQSHQGDKNLVTKKSISTGCQPDD